MKLFTFPPEQEHARQRARTLAWRSIVLVTCSGALLYAVAGSSQTMKTAWITDGLSIVPSIALLLALSYELKPATTRYPYGQYRALAICFLFTAIVLLAMGLFLFGEAALKLLREERPPIGAVSIFGKMVWSGWTMTGALAISMFVGMYCGLVKQPVAKALHSKAIEAESATNRNEWMSEGAGIIGIVIVGFGFWWGDAAAAALVSAQIVKEGVDNLRQVAADMMDEAPTVLGSRELEDLPERVKRVIERSAWVGNAAVRLREHGHLITGEVFVVPRYEHALVARIDELHDEIVAIDWRLHGITIMPVAALEDQVRHEDPDALLSA